MQFHVLAFEGPDGYARAGGIASRVTGLTECLAELGYETHLWFVGDPDLPGCERRNGVELHRWGQWISRHHRAGVYDGEEPKRRDYVSSLPPYLLEHALLPALQRGERAVVLAEEWHTADAVLHLDWLLRGAGVRERVQMLWNANNTFGFDRIDWSRLPHAAVITTVSRYMRRIMRARGVVPIVIANGLDGEALRAPDAAGVQALRRRFDDRTLFAKVGRWDPDKNWLLAIEIVAALKRRGQRPLLLARGGIESHGGEVLAAAHEAGLHVVDREIPGAGTPGLLAATEGIGDADVVNLRSNLDGESRRVLFQGADTVLANSAHEPFGLVGLETMAAGGLACTGNSGEDYAVAGRNALVMQTSDPREFLGLFERVRGDPVAAAALRDSARATAARYAWPQIVERALIPLVSPGVA